MTTKDWILMLIPIIAGAFINGVLIFFIQKRLTFSFDKRVEKEKLNLEVYIIFRELALEFNKSCKIICGTVENEYGLETWSNLDSSLMKLISYYRIHKPILKKYDVYIEQLIKTKLEFNSVLEEVVENLDTWKYTEDLKEGENNVSELIDDVKKYFDKILSLYDYCEKFEKTITKIINM